MTGKASLTKKAPRGKPKTNKTTAAQPRNSIATPGKRKHSEETTRGQSLLLALNRAALAVQRTRTAEGIYRTIQEQMTRLGCKATVFEYDEGEGELSIAYLSYNARLIHKVEEMTGLSSRNYRFRPAEKSIYRRVLTQAETVCVEDVTQAVADALPKGLRSLAQPVTKLFHFESSTFAPLAVFGKVTGILVITGGDLSEADNAAVTAFANQTAIAIQNNRLCEQAQQEIAERKQMEEAQHAAEAKYRALVEEIPAITYIDYADNSARSSFVSPQVKTLLGISQEEWMQGDINFWASLIHPEDRKRALAAYLDTINTGCPFDEEYRMFARDGRMIWVDDHAVLLRDADGRTNSLHGVMLDITGRKQAEEARRASEQRYQTLTEVSPVGIFRADMDGNTTYVNRRWCEIARVSRDDALGNGWLQAVHLDDRIKLAERWQEAVRKKAPSRAEYRFLHPDGTITWVIGQASPETDQEGHVIGYVGTVTDITEGKQAEEEIVRLDRIHTVISQINQAIVRLRSQEELFKEVCGIAVQYGKFLMAWIGLIDTQEHIVRPIVWNGTEEGYLTHFEKISTEDIPTGRGPTGTAVREGKYVCCNDIANDQNMFPWREEALKRGYRASLALPISVNQKIIGVFSLYTGEPFFFNDPEIQMLVEVTDDIAYALEMMENENRRAQAEQKLAESEAEMRAIFAAMQDVVLIIDKDGIYRKIAPTNPGLLYRPAVELLGKSLQDIFPPEEAGKFLFANRKVLATKQIEHIEYDLPIGERRYRFSASITPMTEDATVWVARDISENRQAQALQEAVYRIAVATETTRSLDELFPKIHQIISTVMPAENFYITLYDETRNVLSFPYFRDVADEPYLGELEPGKGLTAYVLKTGKSLLCTQAVHDELERLGAVKLLGVPSAIWLGVPLIIEGKTIGVMVVQHYTDPDAYGEIEQHMLEFVSSQVAIAITRKQADEALQESEEKYRQLFEMESDAILLIANDTGQILDANEGACAMYGFSREELLARKNTDLSAEPEETQTITQGTPVLSDNVVMIPLRFHRKKDGTIFPVEISGRFFIRHGQSVHIAAIRDITKREKADQQIKDQLERLKALHTIDNAINAGFSLEVILDILLKQVARLMHADAAAILLAKPALLSLEYLAAEGFRSRAIEHTEMRFGPNIPGRIAIEQRTMQFSEITISQVDKDFAARWKKEEFKHYIGVPLVAKGQIKGVMEIYHRTPLDPEPAQLDLLETIAGQAAIAIDNVQLFENLQRSNFELAIAYDATIEGWSRALDLRDKETGDHSLRVTDVTLKLALAVGVRESEFNFIRRGALLHDIGKLGVPDHILFKPAQFTKEEWEIMQRHPAHAYEMLSTITYLIPSIDIPFCHHEKWDGTGYPRGLKGEQIPMAARLFAVADVFDALTHDRPYRKAWPVEKALEYIRVQSGNHFDPQVVEAFLKLVGEREGDFTP